MIGDFEYKLISVIIPVYNVEQYLVKCIDSVINQTYKNLQIILVDDESQDSSSEICDNYAQKDKRIVAVHIKHGGTSAARNAGLRIAKGYFLSFVDADDWLSLNYFEFLAGEMERNRADAVRCGITFYENGAIVRSEPRIKFDKVVSGIEAITSSMTFMLKSGSFTTGTCNFLCKFDIVKNNALFFNNNMMYGEDFDWLSRVLFQCSRVVLNSKAMYYYNRDNTGSITHNLDYNIMKADLVREKEFIEFCLLKYDDAVIDFLYYIFSLKLNIQNYIIENKPISLAIDRNFYNYLLLNNKLKNMYRLKMTTVYLLIVFKCPRYLLKCAWKYNFRKIIKIE